MTDATTAALDAAARGWHVFPLRPGTKRPALHGEADCPGIGDCATVHRKWEDRATTDPERIRRAWADVPFNTGIACGPSGLLVVDLDMPKDKGKSSHNSADTPCGAVTFQALCERAGQPVPHTLAVRTASGGMHLYFTAPPGSRIGNSAGRLGRLIDTRGWGGYVVAPGSRTPAGTYEITNPAPVAPLPGWLYAVLTPRQASRVTAPHAATRRPRGRGYVSTAFTAECGAVAHAPEGERNATLLRAARALGRFIASGDLARAVVEDALQEAGEAAGLPPADCRATIRSGLNWSIAHNPRAAA